MNHRLVLKILLVFIAFLAIVSLIYTSNHKKNSKASNKDTKTLLDFENELQGSIQVARWIFENHECNSCHTLSKGGFLGLTPQGMEIGREFQGCPGMLQTVSATTRIPETGWSEHQRKVRRNFTRFGCTTCHQVGEKQITLTAVGSKAALLHMGCSGVMNSLKKVNSDQ